jgi:hypothetical protein
MTVSFSSGLQRFEYPRFFGIALLRGRGVAGRLRDTLKGAQPLRCFGGRHGRIFPILLGNLRNRIRTAAFSSTLAEVHSCFAHHRSNSTLEENNTHTQLG